MLSRTANRLSARAVARAAQRPLATLAVSSSSAFEQQQPVWSGSLSYASPEHDFCAVRVPERVQQAVDAPTESWSNTLSFASAESDFVGTPTPPEATSAEDFYSQAWEFLPNDKQSNFSFASPEADFTATSLPPPSVTVDNGPAFSEVISFASPESDFLATPLPKPVAADEHQPFFSQTLSFASPESDFVAGAEFEQSLPQTLAEALLEKHRALVVTTAQAPFKIVHVNHAWEELCGFTKQQALQHGSLDLIQGPDTDTDLVGNVVKRLREDEQDMREDLYLVNYRSDGSSFVNHVSIGKLKTDLQSDEPHEYFVGILERVAKEQVPLRMAAA